MPYTYSPKYEVNIWQVVLVETRAPGFGEDAWLREPGSYHHAAGESYEHARKRIAADLGRTADVRLIPVEF